MATENYSLAKTATKAAPPLLMVLLIPAAKAALAAAGITVDDQTIYSIVLGGWGAVIGFINWIKNRKKGKIL